MSERTIFEQIIDGDIPADIVYETEDVAAFLDANPLAPGHTLVVPKEPYARLHETPPDLSAAVFEAVRTLAPAIEEAVGADATTIGVNDGPEAGQEVPHLHVHIVPRFEGDGGGPIHAVMASATPPEVGDVAEKIAAQLE
jgi:histidine triad (HIT) family protein